MAVDEGGPSSIVVDGETGRLCEPDAGMLAAAIRQLAEAGGTEVKNLGDGLMVVFASTSGDHRFRRLWWARCRRWR